MKVLICGSRNINDPALVSQAVSQSGTIPTHIISGGARGIDKLAADYAASQGIEFTEYPADWDRYGKRSAIMRWPEQPMQSSPCGMVEAPAQSIRSIWPNRAVNRYSFSCTRPKERNSRHPYELSRKISLAKQKYKRQIGHGSVGCQEEHLKQQSSAATLNRVSEK